MDRRDFFRLCSAAGIGLGSFGLPFDSRLLRTRRAEAAEPFKGPYWVMVNASGGWDPTLLSDPKGNVKNSINGQPVNGFPVEEIGGAGKLRYAPGAGNAAFFQKHQNRLLVLNGVDTRTNNHDTGSRFTWSGLTADGRPSFAALVAAASAPSKPLAFISNGGYDVTAGVIGATRVGGTGVIKSLAFPNRIDANRNDDSDGNSFFTADTYRRIRVARDRRLSDAAKVATLPRLQQSMDLLSNARIGTAELQQIIAELPASDNYGNPIKTQAEVAIAAFKAGLAVSCNLNYGGFDTHGGNNDPNYGQPARLAALLAGVDYLLDLAAQKGLIDKLYVIVGSDFGRTPWLNTGQGKDHWPVTSMLLMGPKVVGNRVVGLTDESLRSKPIDPVTLQPSDAGIVITPSHVHRMLRKIAGIEGSPVTARYPIDAPEVPFLG